MNCKLALGGRSLSLGGPTNLLPDLPTNLAHNQYKKNISLIVGTTRDDGSYVATGKLNSKHNY